MIRRLIWAAFVLTGSIGLTRAADDAMIREGRNLVDTYCSVCHAIGVHGDSPHAQAPPFRTLHERYEDIGWLEEALVEGLVTGHPDMPEWTFEPLQAAAIVAYLKSIN